MVLRTLNSEDGAEWTGERRAVRMVFNVQDWPRNQESAEQKSEISQPDRETLRSQKVAELHVRG